MDGVVHPSSGLRPPSPARGEGVGTRDIASCNSFQAIGRRGSLSTFRLGSPFSPCGRRCPGGADEGCWSDGQTGPGQDRVFDHPRCSQDVVIPETNHGQALARKPSVPDRIARRPGVLRAVAFHHEAVLEADEIDDVAANRHLAASFQAGQSSAAQDAPEFYLGVGGIHSECPRERARFDRDVAVVHGTPLIRQRLHPSSGLRSPSPARGEGHRSGSPQTAQFLSFCYSHEARASQGTQRFARPASDQGLCPGQGSAPW
jgi:hypothetical protein